jgi:hypothetical protein
MPRSSQDVPDELDARLVVLGLDAPHVREAVDPAQAAAKAILEMRGNAPRLYRNTLVFLAVDKTRLQDLDEAARRFLAWQSILNEKTTLDLSPYQVKQAEAQQDSANSTVTARIPEAYQWLLVPVQATPQSPIEWQSIRLSGQEGLAVRASKKLRADELLVVKYAGTRLRMEMDKIPLWRADHVAVRQLIEDYARYLYLPRLHSPEVLLGAVRDGVSLLSWEQDSFAFADSLDEDAGRYRGLRAGVHVMVSDTDSKALVVTPGAARRQFDAEKPVPTGPDAIPVPPGPGPGPKPPISMPPPARPTRFHGSVDLDAARVGRDASRIAEEVVAHLAGIVGAKVQVTLEIAAEVKSGVPEDKVRTVNENCRTLKFKSFGFERE